jgi:hypothetical protein
MRRARKRRHANAPSNACLGAAREVFHSSPVVGGYVVGLVDIEKRRAGLLLLQALCLAQLVGRKIVAQKAPWMLAIVKL